MSDACPELVCCPRPLFDYSLTAYPTYFNSEQSFFIPCPEGFSCTDPDGNIVDGYTVVVLAGTVSFTPKTKEQNTPEYVQQQLEKKAKEYASLQNKPYQAPKLFYNKSMTVTCPDGMFGLFDPSVPFMSGEGELFLPAGIASSTVSQEQADAIALGLGNLTFTLYSSLIQCHWKSKEIILECPEGAEGGPIVVAAGHDISFVSQEDADAQALAYAESQVSTSCLYWNDEQTAYCDAGETGGPFTVPAHTYSSNISKQAANNLAISDVQGQKAIGCTSCTNYPVQDLVWTIDNFYPGNTATAAGGSGGGSTLNAGVSMYADLLNSCNSYQITVSVPYTIRSPGIGIVFPPPEPGRGIELEIDGVIVDSDFLMFPVAGCDTVAGTLTANHTIEPDAYSTANGFHRIKISAGNRGIGGLPDSPGCMLEFTFTITPLTPP